MDTFLCECGHILQACPVYTEKHHQTWPNSVDLTTKLWGTVEDLSDGWICSTTRTKDLMARSLNAEEETKSYIPTWHRLRKREPLIMSWAPLITPWAPTRGAFNLCIHGQILTPYRKGEDYVCKQLYPCRPAAVTLVPVYAADSTLAFPLFKLTLFVIDHRQYL